MLILTRKAGEVIMIGDDVKVQVIEVKGTQVRLGVEAPRTVKVLREEVRLRMLAEEAVGGDQPGT